MSGRGEKRAEIERLVVFNTLGRLVFGEKDKIVQERNRIRTNKAKFSGKNAVEHWQERCRTPAARMQNSGCKDAEFRQEGRGASAGTMLHSAFLCNDFSM